MPSYDAKKSFDMYKMYGVDKRSVTSVSDKEDALLFESSNVSIIPKMVYDKKTTTIDEVVDNSDGAITSTNQISPSSTQPVHNYANNGNSNIPNNSQSIYKGVIEALAGVFGTAILPYNSENPFAIENIAEGLMIGNMVSKKFGKNKTQKVIITAVCMASGVAIKSVIDKKKP